MGTLLLAYGDPEARDMLRKAINARYGTQPPALEYLQLEFNGRARVKLGPIMAWIPVSATAYFNFPRAMRWDFKLKPLGLPLHRGSEAHNGNSYRRGRGNKSTAYTDAEMVSQFRKRLWSVAALMLTPLSGPYVKLEKVANNTFSATNTELGDTVTIALRPDYTVESVQVDCVNPDTQRLQAFKIVLSQAICERNSLVLPESITAYWDESIYFEMSPVNAEFDISIPTEAFRTDLPVNG